MKHGTSRAWFVAALGLMATILAWGTLPSSSTAASPVSSLSTIPDPFRFVRMWSYHAPGGVFNHQPRGMAFDASGNLFVVDGGNQRVQVLDREGRAIRTFGRLGSGPGEFWQPRYVALDSQGNVYVSEGRNNRVQKFTSDGTFLTQFTGLSGATGIAIGSDGSIYVGPAGQIVKLSPDGSSRRTLVSSITGRKTMKLRHEGGTDVIYVLVTNATGYGAVHKYDADGELLATWGGEPGNSFDAQGDVEVDPAGNIYVLNQDSNTLVVRSPADEPVRVQEGFRTPQGLAFGPDGLLYVTDGEGGYIGDPEGRAQMRIQRFTLGGQRVVPTWGSEEGHAPGQTQGVVLGGITWTPTGHIWVHRVTDGSLEQYALDGSFVREIVPPANDIANYQRITAVEADRDGNLLVNYPCEIRKVAPDGAVLQVLQSHPRCADSRYYPNSLFGNPFGFDLDSSGNLYVADPGNERVVKIDAAKQSVERIYSNLAFPYDVAVAADGHVYVLSDVNDPRTGQVKHPILVYTPNSATLEATWYIPDEAANHTITHIEVGADGFIYAFDFEENTLLKLNTSGQVVARIEPGGYGIGPGQFDNTHGWDGFAVDPNGNVYTADWNNGRIQVFTQGDAASTPTATPSGTASPTPSVTGAATHTATLTPTITTTATPSGTALPPETVTPTLTMTITASPGVGVTSTPSPTAALLPTDTPTPTSTQVAGLPTLTQTPTLTVTAPSTGTASPVPERYVVYLPYVRRQ